MASERGNSLTNQTAAGNVPAVAAIDVVALYDPADGHVMHMHHVITLEGAERRPREEQERSARDSADRLGCRGVYGLEVLHVPDFDPGDKTYSVDPEKRTLVEVSAPSRRR